MAIDINSVLEAKRRLGPRSPVNPLDKCTIVSLYPKEICDVKPTVFPHTFRTEKAPSKGDFSITVIGPSSWWKW
jgi:hypothetical protein